MSLKEYEKKRDFKKTPEPKGKSRKAKSGSRYVIQKHAASRLHYDLRLELDGTLKSWAVPKGPSLNPKQKRLAVHVEDHPIEYGSFEGTIPKGQYGGGTVLLWDRGTWESQDGDPGKAYREGKMKFLLHGKKLNGGWALVRMGGKKDGDEDNWLLIKERDDFADAKTDITDAAPDSVATGRSIRDIASAEEPDSTNASKGARKSVRSSRRTATARKSSKSRPKNMQSLIPSEKNTVPGAKRKAQPAELKPQLCMLTKKVPICDAWFHEVKFDGYRTVAYVNDGRAELRSRNGERWTTKLSEIADACGKLKHNCVLDGEVVVQRSDGTTDFQALQNLMRSKKKPTVSYYVFDLVHVDGYDVSSIPLRQRKAILSEVLEELADDALVHYCDHVEGNGDAVFRNACRLNLEGVISKQAESPYIQKRGRYWLKIKCNRRQEFVIGGYTKPRGSRAVFGALMAGYYDDDRNLIYAGKVGTGFTDESLRVIGKELHARERKTAPFRDPPQGPEAKGVTWIAPEFVAEVEFTGWTEDGKLRHPSFKGLRDDKPAKDVRREAAKSLRSVDAGSMESEMKEPPGARARKSSKGHKSTVDGVVVSNPDKEMYPEGISKIALVEYYGRMSRHILPHVVHRPLTLLRCPNGRAKNCFYQKHPQNAVPDSVRSVPIREKEGKADYLVIDDEKGLLELVNLGVLEFHVWGGREDQIEKPDLMVFDLDPDPGVSRAALTEAAFLLRDRLESLGLKSFLKTTGGKGYHVVTPLDRRHSWDDVKEFSLAVAKEMVKNDPKRYIATMSKAKRKGRIFIDYLRNSRGATFVIPYGTRARPHAPVSTPLRWDELKKDTDPAGWTIANIESRLDSVDDPWAEYSSTRQSITVAMKKVMGLR